MTQQQSTQQRKRRYVCSFLSRAALVLLAGVLAVGLAGCKDTSKLTEIIYDQESESIDYDNPTKVLVQDPSATETSDQLPLIEQTEDYPDEETPEEPELGEDEDAEVIPNVSFGAQSANTEYAPTEGGTTVAEGGLSVEEEPEEQDAGGADEESVSEEQTQEFGGGGDVENPDEPDGDTGSNNDIGGTSGARAGGDQTYYNETGAYSEPPRGIDYVAAVGEAATIVSMLAGDRGALLYTDAEWASRANLATVLGNKYNSEVVVAWSEDGNSYDLSDEMLAAMIADERLEAVFETSGEKTLTEEQEVLLQDAGIIVQILPDLTTATRIEEAVAYVGRVFSAGDNANVNAEFLASEYVDFHDRVLEDAAGRADTTTDDNNGLPVRSSNENMYTVYVSDWADDVYYVGYDKVEGGLDTSNGIGIVELGYRWSPLSYYLSVGGAINTASMSIEESGTSLLWQFSLGHITALESDFSRPYLVSSYQVSGNTAYQKVYFTSAYLRTSTSSSGFATGEMRGAGSHYFPYVIVNNQATKAKLEADKASERNSLYKLYPIQVVQREASTLTFVGPLSANISDNPLFAVGGLTGQQTAYQTSQELYANWDSRDYSVVTNPRGLFESWTDGTIESFLETAWISYLYHDGDNPSQTIYDFYSTFYGYSLSTDEIQMILDGEVG